MEVKMPGVSVLMFIFSFFIFLAGIYLYTGHKNELLLWRSHNIDKITKEELRIIGKWTIISSLIPFIIAIIAMLIGE